MKFSIQHKSSLAVLFEGEFDSLKFCVHEAVQKKTNLRGANLRGANHIFSLGFPGGWPGHGWLRDSVLSIHIGCREFRYLEALDYWNNHPEGRGTRLEQLAAVEYAKQVALARGWKVE